MLVENIEDPLMRQIRWLDKLIDELAKGKPMEEDPSQVSNGACRTARQREKERMHIAAYLVDIAALGARWGCSTPTRP